jgi:NAD-dependent SIR2 family protein deacetylase
VTSADPEAELARAAELIAGADALLVCAGAGMGVDSGLPDFRGPEGFWRAYPPYRALGLRFEELADPVHFVADPALAWGFYGHRLRRYRQASPHAGFQVLRRWATRVPLRIFTSNVDGQFQRAGFAEDDVAEVHGSIHHLQCALPCGDGVWPAGGLDVAVDPATMRATGPLPRCPHCGELGRPNILMFGDADWVPSRSQCQLDALTRWRRSLRGAALAVLEIGAGTAVPTVRRQAELASAATGALIRINPHEPHVRHGRGVALPLGAAQALTALDALLSG